ncbi:MAG TPA: TldD/PmbA family protein [Firmicutes bacterium]|nr:TldD/PmbA family protein [Candidatus Fermentithermobacillaceae bacterium]
MIGKEDAFRIMEKTLSYAKGFDIETNLISEDLSLTRFYENHIHQNLRRQDHILSVRTVKGGKVGIAQVNLLDDGSLRWVVNAAREAMEIAQEDPEFPGLPRPEPYSDINTYVSSTANLKPKDRADGCGVVISRSSEKGLVASGSFSTSIREVAVASSLGVRAYNASTEAFFRTIVGSGQNTGYADRLARDSRDIDFEDVAREAIEKATLFPEAREIPPGRYDTIFLEYAVADLLRFLGYIAFGAEAKQRSISFMSRSMGEKVMGDSITIWDDGLDTRGFAIPFDREGVPKKKVVFVENGIAKGVVYDARTAAKEGLKSTGHANPRYGGSPLPQNMFVAPGNATLEEMIRTTKKGLLVTRFHYTHCLEPLRLVATGTTRDGTFLIEDGEISARVNDLRFTESVLEAFSRVDAISGTTRVTRDWWGTFTSVIPALRIRDFNFTRSTAF